MGALKQERTIMSPLTPYSPGLPILQPRGGAGATEVGKGPLMSFSKSSRASTGLAVSIEIFLRPSSMMASPALLMDRYVFESGALVLPAWLPGVMCLNCGNGSTINGAPKA